MPRFVAAMGVVALALVALADPALADGKISVKRRGGADTVSVDGRRVWTGARGERVVSAVRWSKRGDAVAFAVRRLTGGDQLVVVLVGGDIDKHVMRWPIPSAAGADFARVRGRRHRPTVTWMGRQRVAYGPTELRPTVVASWTVR